jgi:hypothetical protein
MEELDNEPMRRRDCRPSRSMEEADESCLDLRRYSGSYRVVSDQL